MTLGSVLGWTPIEWDDPLGGTIRLWPYIPHVVLTDTLRRTAGKWDGIAFLLPDDEPEIWESQVEQERKSPGINRDAISSSGDTYSRMIQGMTTITSIQTNRFPDPEPRRLYQYANSASGSKPSFFIEPNDEEWTKWVEDCADEMTSLRNLASSIFGGRAWKKALRESMLGITPPEIERDDEKAHALALASSLATTWWNRSESMISVELRSRRDLRFAARLRGALRTLTSRQIDDEPPPVLFVPVMQAWLPSIQNALMESPLPEEIEVELDDRS